VTDRIKVPAACARRRPRTYMTLNRVALLVLLMLLFPARGWAAAYGSVSGIVRDDSERPIPGAKVTLESAAHAITQQQTDSAGRFDF
jgi:hypothetical protein